MYHSQWPAHFSLSTLNLFWPKYDQRHNNTPKQNFRANKEEKQKHKQISETLKENITTISLQNDSQ